MRRLPWSYVRDNRSSIEQFQLLDRRSQTFKGLEKGLRFTVLPKLLEVTSECFEGWSGQWMQVPEDSFGIVDLRHEVASIVQGLGAERANLIILAQLTLVSSANDGNRSVP